MKVLLILTLSLCQLTVKAQTVADLQNLGDSLFIRSEQLWQQGDTIGANREMERSIATFYKINFGDNYSFISAEYIHSVRLGIQEKYQEALSLLEDANKRIKKVMPLVTELTCLIDSSLAETYKELKRYDEAIMVGEKMKKDYVRFYGVTSEKYLDALHLLSLIYHSSKIYSKCKDVTSEFLGKSIREGFFDENSFSDCYSLARLGECEYALGNFQEAEDCYQIADSLLAKIEGVDNIRALVLNRRATNLTRLGNAELADSCLNAAFELDSESVLNFVITINNQSVLITEGNPSEAYGMFKLVADYLEENDYQSTPLYAIIKSNVAYSCLLLERTDEGIRFIESAMPILEKNSDFADSNYFTALQTRILLYAQKQDLKMVEKYSEELSAEIERQLHNVFPYLTERQRMDFWNQLSGWSSFTLPFLTVAYQTEGLKKECYNSILQSRGILLNSTLNIDRILRNTDDVLLKELYQQWKTAKQGKMNTYIIDELEKKIMEKLPSQGDFLADMSINTDSIRKYLSDKDIAIEFFSVLDPEVEDTIYAALTIKKRYPEPYIVTLCRSGEVSASLSESFCNTELYNLFWKQLEGEMKGADRVFFAVDGVLHNIPIEYCPDENGNSMFDKYECYRVSSTREIAKNGGSKDDNQIVDFDKSLTKGNIVMYGDIDYNTYGDEDENNGRKAYKDNSYESNAEPADSICADTLEVQSKEYRSIVRGNRFALESFKPLDGTRKELQSIEQMLRTNGIIPIVKTKETATEGSFYDLSEKPLQWLHFATHGYYESEEAVSEFGPMADVDNVVGSPEAMALSRAALVFSGANNWVEMGEKDGGGHDGLLTAYEMSSQDFSNIDMVVMSACESGLGDIGSEGVFGLQRGMKKAGAKSLLMSLCKVDDDATVLFMETFYKALLNKQNKLRALSEAQKAVREEKNGKWSSPQYWASFILLDGF